MDKWASRGIVTGFILAVIGALGFLLSGYGYQWQWWELGTAFNIFLYWGGIIAFAGFILSLAGMIFSRSLGISGKLAMALAGIVLGGATVVSLSYWAQEAGKYPPIHDITTDTENPPAFDAIVPLREDAPNETEYGGEEVAEVQKEHYPEIQTLYLESNYKTTFQKALQAARAEPWEIVEADTATGLIEATHTLPWFGFKDDVVIRVDTAESRSGSKIDVRSVSRLGRGDIGVNAHRISIYLDRLKKQ